MQTERILNFNRTNVFYANNVKQKKRTESVYKLEMLI